MVIDDEYIILSYFSSIKSILNDQIKYINHWSFWLNYKNHLEEICVKNISNLKNEVLDIDCLECQNKLLISTNERLKVFNDFNYTYNDTMGILCCHESHDILHIDDKKLLNTCSIKDFFFFIDKDKIKGIDYNIESTENIIQNDKDSTMDIHTNHNMNNCCNLNLKINNANNVQIRCSFCKSKLVRLF